VSRAHKNEGVSSAQLLLALAGLASEGAALDEANAKLRAASEIDHQGAGEPETEEPAPQPPHRKRPSKELRRIENRILVPEAERACPRCGGVRECIGHDVTEVIDLIPAEIVVRLDLREKLACRPCDGEVARAPQGDKVVSGGKLGSGLVAQLVVDKYADGLPLHRQRERFRRMGLELSVSTLADQVTWAAELLRPLWRAALAGVLGAQVMHLDATGLPVLDRNVDGGKRLGTLWGYVGGETVAAYLYTSTGKKLGQRPGELGPEDVLALRTGFTVADASNLFEASFRRPQLIECGCNMHARRYWIKANDSGDARAALPLAAYKKLYEIEDAIRAREPDEKLRERRDRSKPVFDELLAWAKLHQPHEPPSSPLGVALRYFVNNHVALGRFLESGVVPIDNGIVERLHVRTALTRKNFLFAGSDTGGERAAIAFTLLGCCGLCDIKPVEYLASLLPRLARSVRLCDVPSMLPAAWKAAREQASAIIPSP